MQHLSLGPSAMCSNCKQTGMTKMKTRANGSGSVLLGYTYRPSTHTTVNKYHELSSSKERLILSTNHPGPPYRSGSGFAMQRTTWSTRTSSSVDLRDTSGSLRDEYHGVFVPRLTVPGDGLALSLPALPLDMTAKGTKGWAMFKPGNPVVDMGQFVAELRDLPRLPLQRLRAFRDLGSEYLNVEFGWKPFLSDLKGLYNTYRSYERRIAQLRQHAGRKGVRRGGTISSVNDVVTTQYDNDRTVIYPTLVTSLYGPSNRFRATKTETTGSRYWFSGKFRYYVPPLPNSEWDRRATAALFGVEPTPRLLYEVLPWSWLVDWFSSLGAMVNNLSTNAVDNLAADYAFVMCHTYYTMVFDASGSMKNYPNYENVSCSTTNVVETKVRQRASPFGFGLELPSFSTRQLAILSALGISRRW